jgi:MoaA/NifB/PqqE/SkfB family radical SAM enzyme
MWNKFKSIDFCITSYCQAKCPSCPRTNPDTLDKASWLPLVHVDFEQWTRIMSKNDWSNHTFVFCGEHGDPMMHPRIQDFIGWSETHAEFIHIHTNGGIRKPELYETLAKEHGDKLFITFSIDGIGQETNEQYRIGVDWQRAWDNMIAFKSQSPRRVVWDYIVFEHNWHEIPDVVRIAREEGIRLRMKLNSGYYGKLVNPEGLALFEEYA